MLLLLVGDEALHEAVGHLLAKVDPRSGHVLVDLAAEELDGQVEELDFTLEDAVRHVVGRHQRLSVRLVEMNGAWKND